MLVDTSEWASICNYHSSISSAVLDYPDDKQDSYCNKLWVHDSNLKYFRGKHIATSALVALLIIIIGLPYTIVLLIPWQSVEDGVYRDH